MIRIRRTVTLRLFLRLLPVLALAAALPWTFAYWIDRGWILAVVASAILLGLMWLSLQRALAPLRALFRALAGSVNTYRDGEFNFGVHWRGDDELGELVRAHGELGEVLRQQRQDLVQRELLELEDALAAYIREFQQLPEVPPLLPADRDGSLGPGDEAWLRQRAMEQNRALVRALGVGARRDGAVDGPLGGVSAMMFDGSALLDPWGGPIACLTTGRPELPTLAFRSAMRNGRLPSGS